MLQAEFSENGTFGPDFKNITKNVQSISGPESEIHCPICFRQWHPNIFGHFSNILVTFKKTLFKTKPAFQTSGLDRIGVCDPFLTNRTGVRSQWGVTPVRAKSKIAEIFAKKEDSRCCDYAISYSHPYYLPSDPYYVPS